MSMMKRIFALLLTVAMLVCTLAACNKPKEPEQTDPTTPEVEDTTPEVTTPTEPEFPTTPPKKITSFRVTCGDSAVENFAATELKWYLKEKNLPLSDNGYHISIVIDTDVVEDGYTIVATEDSLTIAGGNNRGLAYGIYDFLEKYIGVHFYSPDTVVVDKNDVMIGGGVLEAFEPAFEVLRNPWQPIEKLAEKDGGNTAETGSTKIINLNTIAGTGYATTCLSDAKIFEQALQKMRAQLSTGKVDAIRFSPVTDYDLYCTCEKCAAVHAEEIEPSGNYIRFLNKLHAALVVDYPNLKFEITPRAYMKKAPAVTKPVDGILIRFDTDQCHISHPLTDTTCPEAVAFAESLNSWGTFCDNVYVEYALTASKDFIPVFANLGTLRADMRFFAESRVGSIRFTGNIVCPTGEFGELRVYLLSKLIQNPLMSEEEYYGYMDSFLEAFYGAGWKNIRKFIDKTTEFAADGHQTKKDSPFLAITEDEYRSYEAIFDSWWNEAEKNAGDRAEFVKRARYQWRYIKLCLHPNATDAQALITDAAGGQRVAWRDKQWNVDTARSNLNLAPSEWVYKS